MNRRWPRRIGIGLAALVVIVVAVWRFYDPGWRYDVLGVDVSHHQGQVDWDALAADGTAFAYIKSTEGGDWVDTRFEENWRGADDAGVLRGAYHFFTLCTAGADQAAHMIATVPDVPDMLPPAVDLEFAGNCSARPSVEEFRVELDVFLAEIEEHYRMRPVIYTNAHFYTEYLDEGPPEAVWWMQSPILEPWGSPDWTLWQYTPGPKDGVDGDVDRNVFDGNLADLRALTNRGTG